MTDGHTSDESDEWGVEELVIPVKQLPQPKPNSDAPGGNQMDEEDYWKVPPRATVSTDKQTVTESTHRMILVDMTALDCNIHSKFDKNSVSDPGAVSTMRKKLEANYKEFADNAALLAAGTIIPCASSVWREALLRVRQERPGHYFAPIFPPKTS